MNAAPEVPIDTFIPFMRDVVRCESALRELNLMWRLIESSAKMNCPEEAHNILPMMTATREGFQRLETDLVKSLVAQSVAEVMDEIGTNAHHVIDIVVRNLYERTADVGFLATDQDLCNFVAGRGGDPAGIRMRLREYRNKYTVYDEIMLLDRHGAVMVQIDESSPVEGSQDPLIAQALASPGYIETFRQTDLRPHKRHALVYAQRMLHPTTREPVGVLCLGFAFESEMDGIFHSRSHEDQCSIQLLLDGQHRVLASSDPLWIPVGATVPVNEAGVPELKVYSGRAYLVQTVAAAHYQDYPGPEGWRGQVMVPVELAFSGASGRVLDGLEPSVAQGLLGHAEHFCPPLHSIVTAADTIRRVVWNGQVMSGGRQEDAVRLKAVLEQIGETGARTNEVFTRSIRDLYGAVLHSSIRDGQCLTQLLVEILDRNLYERANDCRWWALTPELQGLLGDAAAGHASAATVQRARHILEHINSLYTVYSRLMVYDRSGRILASSRPVLANGQSVEGTYIEDDSLAAVLQMAADTQSYHVTAWRSSGHYDDRPTYTYHAAIRASADASQIVGGIAIVFHAAQELDAMLRSPVAAKTRTHCFYTDRAGHVLASTDPATPAGGQLQVPADLLQVASASSESRVLEYQGEYCIVSCTASSGYREFKVSDGYQEDVLAFSVQSFGAIQADAQDAARRRHTQLLAEATTEASREMATFFVKDVLLALETRDVVEALVATQIASVSATRQAYCVGTIAHHSQGRGREYLWVFDLGQMLSGTPTAITAQHQVVIVRHGAGMVGLLVSELHGVIRFPSTQFFSAPRGADVKGSIVTELIRVNGSRVLLQCLGIEPLMTVLRGDTAMKAAA